MIISLYHYFLLPIDTTVVNPKLGRIATEDMETEKYLVAIYDTSFDPQGYELMTFTDLQEFRIFKTKEDAQAYYVANWP